MSTKTENISSELGEHEHELDMDMEFGCGDTMEDIKLLQSTLIATEETSEFFTSNEAIDPPPSNVDVGYASIPDYAHSSSMFVSTRIERMMQTRSQYATEVGFEIEASKDHWSQLDFDRSIDEIAETNQEVFQKLQKEWGGFFYDYGDRLVVGRKIAEGAQAEIFEAHIEYLNGNKVEYALKVFKEDRSLQDLLKQWPDGMLQKIDGGGILTRKGYLLYDGTLLQNGRFAFRMQRCWGDLRKLIDLRMQRKCNRNKCFPFTDEEASRTMFDIAKGMRDLHESSIVHRDLKASNVLVFPFWEHTDLKVWDPTYDKFHCDVTDYECALEVVGTGFWRAPEILLAINNRGIKPHVFTEKSDVYSFGMTCYEILTGRLPFEDVARSDYDHVLRGGRPKLPESIKPALKVLLIGCWHQDTSKRPTFNEILQCLLPKCPISNSYLAVK